MSLANSSQCACPTPVTTDVPGSPGDPGTDGTNGVNAFSITQASFVVPAISSSVSVTVDNNSWMVINQPVFVAGAGFFSVNSLAGTTVAGLTYLNYTGNTATGNTIASGAQISPGGTQQDIAIPIPIADGGTNATDKADAQTNLGLGQNATFANVSGLSQSVATSPTLIAGATVTIPAAGVYLVQAFATVDFSGVTIGTAAEVITLSVEDTTATTQISTSAKNVPVITTTSYPSHDWITPPLTATLTSGDVLQVQISISQNHAGNPTAGTIKVSSAGLIITPLALS